MKKLYPLFFVMLFAVNTLYANYTLKSPDGNLVFNLFANNGNLTYDIFYQQTKVILPSELGITAWENNLEIEKVETESVDEVWRPVYGERAEVKNHYNQAIYIIKKDGTANRLHLIVRAYDTGVAFRYHYEGTNQNLCINSEKTSFIVPENTYCWYAPYAQAIHTRMLVENWPGEAERPLTLQLENGLYASLLEAEMVNYSRTKFFVKGGEKNIIRCKMYDPVEDFIPFTTPWRAIMVAKQPIDLLEHNDLILNLNNSCQVRNTNWIKPGTVIRCVSFSMEGVKKTIDLAAERNIQYIHFDSGWYGPEISKKSDPRVAQHGLDIPKIVKYANSKGVGLWLYVNQRALTEHLDEILPLYESWGVAGIKFGFVHVGSYKWTTWLHSAVAKCAKHHLMVDIHDEYRPTGFSRTYPNLLTQEGVRGNEEFPDGINNTTLPFTRFLAGAADCTVCYYHRKGIKSNLKINARSLLNTSCHQMALSVINYSPLQFLYWYDSPDDFQNEPELPFFDHLPTTWDDTKVVEGSIGEYVSIARKKDNVWYVGSITNNEERKFEFPLNFLDANKKYELTLYMDGGKEVNTRTHVAIQQKAVTAKTVLKLNLLPRGGCAMIICEK
ncbi:glycoside hydrolase family 97 protein [Dysgonomonas reticulitermitis]